MNAGEPVPSGTAPVDGIVHRRSPLPVAETVQRLTGAIQAAGAKLFADIDQSAEAASVGLSLRETRLVIFGNPAGGTPVMQAAPLTALDLPLKILVWADDLGVVWMTYLSPQWLSTRHGLTADLAQPLDAVEALTTRVVQGAP
jgi:uncharacterized protein (DUF302 family)